MYPILFHFGSLTISTLGVFVTIGFIGGSFLVWRQLRDYGNSDEKVFDNILVIAAFCLIGARIGAVITQWSIFKENLLRILVIWKFPGLSVWGAFFGGLVTFILYSKKQKLSLSQLFDSYGAALPFLILCFSLGIFFDGSLTGIETSLPWGFSQVALEGRRHPVSLYAALLALAVLIIAQLLKSKLQSKKLPHGVIGSMFLSIFGLIMLVVAFFRSNLLYLGGISVYHVVATIVFLTPVLPIFTLLNGKEKVKNLVSTTFIKLKRNK